MQNFNGDSILQTNTVMITLLNYRQLEIESYQVKAVQQSNNYCLACISKILIGIVSI